MGRVTFNAAQVPSNPTYNWSIRDGIIGALDIGVVSTDAPGVGPGLGVNNINTSVAPRPIFQPFVGQIVHALENTLGAGEFIYLAVPVSTALPLGTMVTWEFDPTGVYRAILAPTAANTGAPVAVSIASTVYASGLGITSNATQVQYAWFQIGGAAQVLKTAVQVPPVTTATGDLLFVSGTAGRVYITSSAGKAILGSRRGNQTTVTATASCVLVYLNGRAILEGP